MTASHVMDRPFGLAKAVPVRPDADAYPALNLCPELQISVTVDDRQPFIHTPSMASKLTTTAQTREDSQLDEETEKDTD